MNYWWSCLTTNFANLSGRARRKEIWMFAIFNAIAVIVLGLLFGVIGEGIYNLIAFVPGLAVTVRRLHDTGRSGWWCFINLIPLIGNIWFFILVYCVDSQYGENQYGPNPKDLENAA